MDVGKVASLYITGSEEAIAGNDMICLYLLRRPITREQFLAANERFIRENEPIRSRWDEEDASFRPFPGDDVERLLALDRERHTRPCDEGALLSEYHRTNERLPYRAALVGDRRLFLAMNHALANGLGANAWGGRFLRCLAREEGIELPPEAHPAPARRRILPVRALAALAGFFFVVLYLIGFLARAGRHAARSTVDLTHGKTPRPNAAGFAVRRYLFTEAQTDRIIAGSRERSCTVSERMCALLAERFLERDPSRNRVCMSLPVDLRPALPHLDRFATGNYTGSLVIQVSRGSSAERQVRRAFRWFRRGVPLRLTSLVGALFGKPAKLRDHFARRALMPIPERAPLENFTCAYSNMGAVKDPVLEQLVERVSGYAKTQTVFVSPMTIHGRMTVVVTLPRDLFREEEVFAVTDAVMAALLPGETVSREDA